MYYDTIPYDVLTVSINFGWHGTNIVRIEKKEQIILIENWTLKANSFRNV